jgi:glyoxylase-like metal-dependent hydrolase (beta-lactamase superfamily II)
LRKSQSKRRASLTVSAARVSAEFSVAKLWSQRLTGTRSTGAPRKAAITRSRLVIVPSSRQPAGADAPRRERLASTLADHSTVPRTGGSPAMYEVLALKYAERDTTKCQFFYRESSHDTLTLDYFVWLILGGPQPLLVDTGFLEDDARARGIRNYVSPAAMVERAGVKAADIPISLITHLHYDHWAGHSLFPNAEFWIQGEEVAFWTGPFGRTPAFRGSANVDALARLVTLNYANKVRIVEGDHEVWPGIRVHRVGGHTAGLQIVTVETRRGTVVLTSDASHFYHNVETRQPVQIITSLPEMLTAFETIDRLAGSAKLVVAGHDPQVADRFKPIEPGIIKIA